MQEIMNILENLSQFLSSIGIWGGMLACLLIMSEAIFSFLPLSAFITVVFYTFGHLIGFLASYVFTILGCLISYFICKKVIRKWMKKYIKKHKKMQKIDDYIHLFDKISLPSLAVLFAIPFTPGSFINIAAGIADMEPKKYITSLFIGKLFIVYFWGYIGTSLIDNITNPTELIKIVIVILVVYIISKLINKKLNID